MKFTVRFECNYSNYPIFVQQRNAGIKWLDHVRDALGLPRFPVEKVPSLFDFFCVRSVTIEVSEREARNIGLFADSSTVTVGVPSSSLSKFVIPSFKHKIGDDGIVHSIENYYIVDNDSILALWIKDGCQKEWYPSAD